MYVYIYIYMHLSGIPCFFIYILFLLPVHNWKLPQTFFQNNV